MADVFVSYARSDDARAEQVAAALRADGHSVWRDDELPVHRSYADVIQEQVSSAQAVVVLWSAEAAKSQWVRSEADTARAIGTLVQARLDEDRPPMPFDQIQCADLTEWDGSSDGLQWHKLAASVAALGLKRTNAEAHVGRASSREVSICVLPFQNMSGDAEQEYFSDGISEDITTDLSKISALEVIARNTAFTFKGRAVDVSEIARKLSVTHVLEGSVRKAGNRVRITAQLIDGRSGGHVWAQRYDRELTDIFAVQDEISELIVAALKLTLLPEEKKAIETRGTTVADAYSLYLLARQSWISGDFGDRRREEKVIRICRKATELDPEYAQAWALMGLAQANLRHGFMGEEDSDDGRVSAERALRLDPGIAEAYLPIAWHFAEHACHDQANAQVATALRLNPQSWEVNKEAARLFYRQGRLQDAAFHLEKATQVMEADFHGLGMLFAYYHAQGDIDGEERSARRVIRQVEKVLAADPDNGAALAFGASCLASLGELERAKEWIERGLLVDPGNLMMRYNFAWGLNEIFKDPDGAIAMIEPVMASAGANIIRLAVHDPNIDSLRDEPRFAQMIAAAKERVKLA